MANTRLRAPQVLSFPPPLLSLLSITSQGSPARQAREDTGRTYTTEWADWLTGEDALLRRETLKKAFPTIFFALAGRTLRQPTFAVALLRALATERSDYETSCPELTYLAVAPDARGASCGTRLITAFDSRLPQREVTSCALEALWGLRDDVARAGGGTGGTDDYISEAELAPDDVLALAGAAEAELLLGDGERARALALHGYALEEHLGRQLEPATRLRLQEVMESADALAAPEGRRGEGDEPDRLERR